MFLHVEDFYHIEIVNELSGLSAEVQCAFAFRIQYQIENAQAICDTYYCEYCA